MVNIIVELSKYVMIVMMAVYTFECFAVFGYEDRDTQNGILLRQNFLMFMTHFVAFMVMYLQTEEKKMLLFYGMQVVLFVVILVAYNLIYPKISRLVVNNMCMLLTMGFIMITRLSYSLAVKQFLIAAAAVVVSLFVPIIIRKAKVLSEWTKFYAVAGIVMLALVIVAGRTTGGALLGFNIGGISVQPSELVKIIFVFYVASSLKENRSFKHIVITTIVAAMHVLILVVSKDLGAALIIFSVYLVMLYVATRQPLYVFAGLGAGSAASVVAYHLFSHVRVRVVAWQDPFASYQSGAGYQVAQSLMAIGTGSWLGMGLMQGAAQKIPVSESDFIFAAIAEEMGVIIAICLVLICVSVYIMFLNIAMQLRDSFYKLIALGLGTCYIIQVFLNIGGVTKFIPSTGVTLPLVSYGGSSVISTIIMFGIIQGLYILREDEEEDIEREKAEQERARQSRYAPSGSRPRKSSRRDKEKAQAKYTQKGNRAVEEERASRRTSGTRRQTSSGTGSQRESSSGKTRKKAHY